MKVDPEAGASPLLQPPGALQSLFSIRVSRDVLFLGGICAALTLQNSSYTLLRRYSSGVLREEASSQSILAMGELLKMTFCIWMMARAKSRRLASDEDEGADDGRRATSLVGQLARLASTSLPMAVPALIFLAMNLLSFISLRRISASAFTLIQQSKIIFTALLSRCLLGKQLSALRWRSLCSLLFAVLIICHETRRALDTAAGCAPPDEVSAAAAKAAAVKEASQAEFFVGVVAVATEAALSGASNVYFEKVLKSTSLTVWERNVQLAAYSLLIYVPMALWVSPNLLHGWSPLTWLVAFLGALGGILIGLVINYCDSIVKNLALSCAIILTATIDFLWFAGPMTLPIIASAGAVIISILNYTSG